ncbi:MAG: hypothetical protein HY741_18375, partial [Chloroflexi bacterium]|nr:hypothetical protein [Chloroflexota bacterium]
MKSKMNNRFLFAIACSLGLLLVGCSSPAPSKPVVVINSPPSGTAVDANNPVLVQVTGTDSAGVVRIDLGVNGVLAASESSPTPNGQPIFPVTLRWMPPAPGTYVVEAIAYNRNGESSKSAGISILVKEGVAGLSPSTAVPSPTSVSPTTIAPSTDMSSPTIAPPTLPSSVPANPPETQTPASNSPQSQPTDQPGSQPPADTQGPPAPVIVGPKDNAQLSCVAMITLRWNAPSDPSGILNYRVRLEKQIGANYGEDQVFDPVVGTQLNVSSQTDCGNTYRWRLLARDGRSNEGQVS